MKKRRAEGFTQSEPDTQGIRDYEKQLSIDRGDLDECLIRQPELLFHVSEQLVLALDTRDSLKLALEEAEAAEDNKIRALAERNEDKITEPFVRKQIAAAPKVQQLGQELLEAKKLVGLWEALKEGFKQRSYALSSLVDLHISRVPGSSGSYGLTALAESNHARANEERRKRREA